MPFYFCLFIFALRQSYPIQCLSSGHKQCPPILAAKDESGGAFGRWNYGRLLSVLAEDIKIAVGYIQFTRGVGHGAELSFFGKINQVGKGTLGIDIHFHYTFVVFINCKQGLTGKGFHQGTGACQIIANRDDGASIGCQPAFLYLCYRHSIEIMPVAPAVGGLKGFVQVADGTHRNFLQRLDRFIRIGRIKGIDQGSKACISPHTEGST